MAGAPPNYPPNYPPQGDWKYQRRMMRDQARAQRDISKAQWKMYRDQQREQVRGMRGGSILGPLVLIAVGVVFLLLRTGRLDYGEAAMWYGHWWPLLLLLGGVVLLAEWAFERSRADDQPYVYRRRGGVIFLLFLLCIPGFILGASHGDVRWMEHGFSVNPDNIGEMWGDRHESDQVIDQAFAAGSTLLINNPHGDVLVTGASDDGQIHVAVHKLVSSFSESDANNKMARLAPTLTTSGPVATLNVPAVDASQADVRVTLPSGTGLTVTANHGAVHVSSLRAPLTVTANHGDVELDGIGGAVTAHVNHRGSSFDARGVAGPLTLDGNCGDVNIANVNGVLTLNGDFFGTTRLDHVGGAVRFHTSRTDFQVARLDGEVEIQHGELSGDQILGPVSLSARSYNVTLDRVAGDVSVTTSDGTVDLTSAPPLGNVTILNRNGSVSVTLPENAAFTVQAETKDGDVETDFPLSKTDDDKVSRLSGTVGNGGSLIRIDTTQNDVSIKKGVIAPLAPLAPPAPLTVAPGPRPVGSGGKRSAKPAPPLAPPVGTNF